MQETFAKMNQEQKNGQQKQVDLNQIYQFHQRQQNPENNLQQMAPCEKYKINYKKFMNFQRFYLFQSKDTQLSENKPLTIFQLKKLNRLIISLYQNYQAKILQADDIKGLWAIIAFIFPARTGLFLNQFFQILINKKINLSLYKDPWEQKEIYALSLTYQKEVWLQDKNFTNNFQVLLKQSKNYSQKEENIVYTSFTKALGVLSQSVQTSKYIEVLIQSMKQFGVFSQINPKQKQNYFESYPLIDGNSVFDPNDMYVLSEPDTLVADICQSFQASQYKHIKRKMSNSQDLDEKFKLYNEKQLYMDEDTETHFHQRTVGKSTPQKVENQRSTQKKKNAANIQFKRKIHFDSNFGNAASNLFSQQTNSNDQKTKAKPFKKSNRPPREKYIQNMIINHRKIEKDLERKQQRRKQKKVNKQKLKKHNKQIEKQIRKVNIINPKIDKRQKRNNQQRQNYTKLAYNYDNSSRQKSVKKSQQQNFQDWKNSFPDDESVNYSNSNRMQIEQDNSNSLRIINRRKIFNKKEQKKPKPKTVLFRNKRVELISLRKKQKQFIDQGQYLQSQQGEQNEKTRQKVNVKKLRSQKQRGDSKVRLQSNYEKEQLRKPNEKKTANKLKNQLKTKRLIAIRSNQTNILNQFEIANESQFLDQQNYSLSQLMDENNTRNFERNERLKPVQANKLPLFTKRNLAKYSHLLSEQQIKDKKQNKNGIKDKTMNLDNYIISNKARKQQTQPFESLFYRKLAVLQFQQCPQIQEKMMITETLENNLFTKFKQQVSIYDHINRMKMDFDMSEYLSYLQSFETKKQIQKQVNLVTNQYLSTLSDKTKAQNHFKNQQSSKKQALIARKILSLHVLCRVQIIKSSNSSNMESVFFSSYHQTHILPLLRHHIFKIIVNLLGQTINSLYTSEGDQDFQLLNKTSLPILMLLYDIRMLSNEMKFTNLNICKILFEEIYKIFDIQTSIFFHQIIISLNENILKNTYLQQNLTNLLKQNAMSQVYLLKNSKKNLDRSLRINLSSTHTIISAFAAYTIIEQSLFKKITLLFSTLPQRYDSKEIKQIRLSKFLEKGFIIEFIQNLLKVINTVSLQQKETQLVLNFIQINLKILKEKNFQSQKQIFDISSRILTKFIKCLKEIQKKVPTYINRNTAKYTENIKRAKIMQLCKQIIRFSLTQYIYYQIGNVFNENSLQSRQINPLAIVNKVTVQQLKQIKEHSSNRINQTQVEINIELTLQICTIFMNFKEFRQHQTFNRTFILKTIEKALIQFKQPNKPQEKTYQIFKSVFHLLLKGYKCQIFSKQNIWKTNNQVVSNNFNVLYPPKDLAQQYWNQIKQCFKIIYQKFKYYSRILNQTEIKDKPQNKNQDEESIQNKKIKIYFDLLNYMIKNLTENTNETFKTFKNQQFYNYCNQQNSLCYSLRHLLVNISSFYAEYNFFIELQIFENLNDYKCLVIDSLTHLPALTDIDAEINVRESQKQDKEELDDALFELDLQRGGKRSQITKKWLTVVCSKINQNQRNSRSNAKSGIIQFILMIKPYFVQSTESNQNQKQKNSKNSISFANCIKKHEYLSLNYNLNSTTCGNSQYSIKENQTQEIERYWQFLLSFSKTLFSVSQKLQASTKDVNRIQLILKQVFLASLATKSLSLNVVSGVILKRMLYFSNNNVFQPNEFSIEKNKQKQIQQLENYFDLIKFWCKLYQLSKVEGTLILNNLNAIDFNSLLYKVFKQLQIKKSIILKNCSYEKTNLFFEALNICLANTQGQRAAFSLFAESIYNYMVSLSNYFNKSNHEQRNNKSQWNKFNLYFHNVSLNYVKLFITVQMWPELLAQTLKKVKAEFQNLNFIINTNEQIAIHSKSLIQGLILTHNKFDCQEQYQQYVLSPQSLKQPVQIIDECLFSTQQLQSNVFQIKEAIPNSLLLYLSKKIIQFQIQSKNYSAEAQNKNKKSGFNLFNQQNNLNNKKNVRIDELKLFKKLYENFRESSKASSLARSQFGLNFTSDLLSKFINCIKPKTGVRYQSQQACVNQFDVKLQRYMNEIHLAGSRQILYYKQRVLNTFLILMKESKEQRNRVEEIFWKNLQTIQNYLQARIKIQQQNKILCNNNLLRNNNSQANGLKIYTNQKTKNQRQYRYIESIIFKCMIGEYSDFYLIQMVLKSRLQNLNNLKKIKIEEEQIEQRKNLLMLAISKSVQTAQQINKKKTGNKLQARDQSHEQVGLFSKNTLCNEDLQQWFRQSLNEFVKRQHLNQKSQQNQQNRQNQFSSHSNQFNADLNQYNSPRLQQPTQKMEIQQ